MSRRCELTSKAVQSGNKVSHSNRKTRTRFLPNLVKVTLISDALERAVRLRVSAAALRSVEHRGGLDNFLTKAREEQLSAGAAELKRQIAKKRAKTEVGTQGGVKTPCPSSNVSDPSRVGTRSPTGPGLGRRARPSSLLAGKNAAIILRSAAFQKDYPEKPNDSRRFQQNSLLGRTGNFFAEQGIRIPCSTESREKAGISRA